MSAHFTQMREHVSTCHSLDLRRHSNAPEGGGEHSPGLRPPSAGDALGWWPKGVPLSPKHRQALWRPFRHARQVKVMAGVKVRKFNRFETQH
jgi:hypothetical protein